MHLTVFAVLIYAYLHSFFKFATASPVPEVVTEIGFDNNFKLEVCVPNPSDLNMCTLSYWTNTAWNADPKTEHGVALMFDNACDEIGKNWWMKAADLATGVMVSSTSRLSTSVLLQVSWVPNPSFIMKHGTRTYSISGKVDNIEMKVMYPDKTVHIRNETLSNGVYDLYRVPFHCY